MSLDEHTLEWLKASEDSELRYGFASCRYCQYFKATYDDWTGNCSFLGCPKIERPNFRDAAEFEARVAASLTGDMPYAFGFCSLCKYNTHGCRDLTMPLKQCLIKHARLAVEAEMEMEGK